jgi:hypothetical protein
VAWLWSCLQWRNKSLSVYINGRAREGGTGVLQNHSGWQTARNIVLTRAEFRTGHRASLPRLLYRFRTSSSTHSQDAIYALLALSTEEGDVIPNYRLHTHDVFTLCTEVATCFMHKHRNLDVLSLCPTWDLFPDHRLPSWVPDFTHPFAMTPISLGVFGDGANPKMFGTGALALLRLFQPHPTLPF